MLMPKRVKYRKPFSAPRIKGNAKRGTEVVFGEYGLKALEPKERVQMFERLMQYVVPKQQAVSADLQDLRARNRPLVERLAMLARGEEIPKDEE